MAANLPQTSPVPLQLEVKDAEVAVGALIGKLFELSNIYLIELYVT